MIVSIFLQQNISTQLHMSCWLRRFPQKWKFLFTNVSIRCLTCTSILWSSTRQKFLTSANIVINRLFPECYFFTNNLQSRLSFIVMYLLLVKTKNGKKWKNNDPEITDLLRYWPIILYIVYYIIIQANVCLFVCLLFYALFSILFHHFSAVGRTNRLSYPVITNFSTSDRLLIATVKDQWSLNRIIIRDQLSWKSRLAWRWNRRTLKYK